MHKHVARFTVYLLLLLGTVNVVYMTYVMYRANQFLDDAGLTLIQQTKEPQE